MLSSEQLDRTRRFPCVWYEGVMAGSDGPAGGTLYESCVGILASTSAAAVVVDLLTRRIVLASEPAQRLLAADSEDILGSDVEAYFVVASGGLAMVAAGTLSGYETLRHLVAPDGQREIRGWVKALEDGTPPTHALVVLQDMASVEPFGFAQSGDLSLPTVAGVTDHRLIITHITADVEELTGYPPRQVIGVPFLDLFVADDVPDALWALAQASRSATGVTAVVRSRTSDGRLVACHLVIVSLLPRPTFGFAVMPSLDGPGMTGRAQGAERVFGEIATTMRAAELLRRTPEIHDAHPALLSRLSARELEVVSLLLRGVRPPAIARGLYVSQSTVRNHLSSAFRKLDVQSQQGLIDKLRSEHRKKGT